MSHIFSNMLCFAGHCKNMKGDFCLLTDFILSANLALIKQFVSAISVVKDVLLGVVTRTIHKGGDGDRVNKNKRG